MLIYFHSFSLHLSVSRYCALLSFKVTPAFPFPALSLTAGARSDTREVQQMKHRWNDDNVDEVDRRCNQTFPTT